MGQYQILKMSCNLPKSCTKKTITWKRTEQFFKIVDTNLPENFTSVWLRAIMCWLNQSFNLPPWATPRAFEFLKITGQIPPYPSQMLFKCPTLGSIQVIKCPHPRYI